MDKHTRIKREQVEPLRSSDLDATNTPTPGQVLAKSSDDRFIWINNLLDIVSIYVEKLNIVDADVTVISDSESNGTVKRLSWQTIKTILKNYFNGIYTSPNSLKTMYQESIEENNTSSAKYINKLTLHIIPMPGEYVFEWNFQIASTPLLCNSKYKVYADGEIYSEAELNSNLIFGSRSWQDIVGFKKLTLTTTPIKFYIDFCKSGTGKAYIKNAKLLLRRIVI